MGKIMIKANYLLAVVLLLAAMLPHVSSAEDGKPEEKPTGELAASVLSAYIWRGQELSRNSTVVQPSVTLNYKGLSANVWGNLDTKPYAAAGEQYASNYTETDVTFSYSRKIGIVQVGAGYLYYGLAAAVPGGTDPLDSQELFATLGLDTVFAPTLTVYKEIDHYHQWYALLGVSHTFTLHQKVGLKLAATASYLKSEDASTYAKYDSNSAATADKFNNFHDGTVSISLPVAVTKSLIIVPILNYVFPLCDDAKYEMKGRGLKGTAIPSDRDSAYLYGGVAVSFIF